MSKFKVGDKVAYKTNPYECIGEAVVRILPNSIMIVTKDYEFIIEPEDNIVAHEKEIDMSDDDIYDMLKPKLDKADVLKYGYYYHDHTMFNADETIKAIALAYRSGYLRAKKGRPFKIGGEKKKGGH